MRIAYLTAYDPQNVHYWSGTDRFILKSLANRGVDLEFLAPLDVPWWVHKVCGVKRRFYTHIQKKFYWEDSDLRAVRARSLAAFRRLQSIKPVDAVFAPRFFSCAFLPGDVPLVVYNDCTQKGLFETYPIHFNMAREHYANAPVLEKSTHRRASALVYSCDWAAQSAIKDYGASPDKIHIVPFGANLENPPSRAVVEQAIEARDRRQLRLLFIGVDWERKGGPAALAVVRHLNQTGLPATLTVIGCNPRLDMEDQKFVNCLGFLRKDGPDRARIEQELLRSHFLIMLSVAECFGIVYCEGSAFGVPSIARDVGGVPDAVRNGRNGQRFKLEDSPVTIAEWIRTIFCQGESYRRLALASRAEYEAHLNWDVAGERLERVLRDVIA